jgi:hypothetical protein
VSLRPAGLSFLGVKKVVRPLFSHPNSFLEKATDIIASLVKNLALLDYT